MQQQMGFHSFQTIATDYKPVHHKDDSAASSAMLYASLPSSGTVAGMREADGPLLCLASGLNGLRSTFSKFFHLGAWDEHVGALPLLMSMSRDDAARSGQLVRCRGRAHHTSATDISANPFDSGSPPLPQHAIPADGSLRL